ncbi:uncharacterized protein K460DRAFT_294354 [Cucurbitaria berberidis CBS 394.84]|uniref:Uncharacterized protein n=1 Tax=Cucurbitaria berberidis CBS 394.84 TaxID=1168544 RepID=A0A9P4L4F3_9PLEO|nr:uncharacterized protein K460DRAFT_294354 [Cucurbitaria berberidis CBS 394.84]KAF1841252.1 hypothetical protein K460DRAFT_294354 [Cucurbitaria berberidis CBS 394.84]
MKPSPRQAEPSLRQSKYYIQDIPPGRPYTSSNLESNHNTYFEDAIHTRREPETLHEYGAAFNQRYGDANDFSQCHMPNMSLNPETFSHDPHSSEAAPRFAARNDNKHLRGVEKYAELPSPNIQNRERGRGEGYLSEQGSHLNNMHRRSISLTSPAIKPMQLLTYPSSRHSSAPPQAAGQSSFAPFGHHFNTSEDAKRHRHITMRFDRHAYDENDESITLVEANRQRHVERIYNAMTRGDLARDNVGSTAMKRWTREPHYASDLVEAYAHKVFDCLLEQAKEGFRGWHHNDYVADDRKGEDEDRDVNCAGRLDNVITALEQEKTICEDVMNSACQIRMFVNAPKAYSNRKHQNRVGNSKRPGAKANALDPNPRASKLRKTGGRGSRARSSTTSDIPASAKQSPCELAKLPYFTNPSLKRISSSSPLGDFLAPPGVPVHQPISRSHRSSFGEHQVSTMSLSSTLPLAQSYGLQQPNTAHIMAMPPALLSPFMSPPSLSHGHFSAPATPDEVKPLDGNILLSPWQHADTFGESPCTTFQRPGNPEDSLFTQVIDWSQDVSAFTPFTSCTATESANYFEHHPEAGVSLADVEQLPSNQAGNSEHDTEFSAFWQQQQEVQPFPNNDPHSNYPDQS